jgi:hypothetical protein
MNHRSKLLSAIAVAAALAWTAPAYAHCDTVDGPVVASAHQALETGNVNLVLVWVRKSDEAEIRSAFQRASNVRKAGGEARQLADTAFYETLVRVHRAGEGAPYDGLKPAGTVEPPVAAADKAIESGRLQGLGKMIAERNEKGLHERFDQVMAKKKYATNDVEAGRAYTSAYVEFVHYAERLYDAAGTAGHEAATAPAAHAHSGAARRGRTRAAPARRLLRPAPAGLPTRACGSSAPR